LLAQRTQMAPGLGHVLGSAAVGGVVAVLAVVGRVRLAVAGPVDVLAVVGPVGEWPAWSRCCPWPARSAS